ncbi:MAG: GNAT family N-acetyltransferase [Proteobacteria bacterium]|nr:GNAT family N-acetyltransferase [Pseudomonadota bacterium]
MPVRPAADSEIDALARLWYNGWQDAHAAILPKALARARTFDSFAERLHDAQADLRVIGPPGAPLGFHLVKADELYQFYVAAAARGQGIAQQLIADAEARLAGQGHATAWLACAIGNERAARFYEKSGWRRSGNIVSRLETVDGPFDLEVWRYEKRFVPR